MVKKALGRDKIVRMNCEKKKGGQDTEEGEAPSGVTVSETFLITAASTSGGFWCLLCLRIFYLSSMPLLLRP